MWKFLLFTSTLALAQTHIPSRKKPEVSKTNSSTKLDFDETDISAKRHVPLESYMGKKDEKKSYEFVKIRTDWRQEIIQSAKSIESNGRKLQYSQEIQN